MNCKSITAAARPFGQTHLSPPAVNNNLKGKSIAWRQAQSDASSKPAPLPPQERSFHLCQCPRSLVAQVKF